MELICMYLVYHSLHLQTHIIIAYRCIGNCLYVCYGGGGGSQKAKLEVPVVPTIGTCLPRHRLQLSSLYSGAAESPDPIFV